MELAPAIANLLGQERKTQSQRSQLDKLISLILVQAAGDRPATTSNAADAEPSSEAIFDQLTELARAGDRQLVAPAKQWLAQAGATQLLIQGESRTRRDSIKR